MSFLFLFFSNLLPVNGQAQKELRYVIQEELAVGSQVADLTLDADLGQRFGKDAVGLLRFRFLSQPPCDIGVEESTGIVTTRGRIDRETICKDDDLCRFRLDVAVTPMNFFTIVKLSIEVADINDNEPEFNPSRVRHEMSESSQLDAAFTIPRARDKDLRRNSVDRYELVSSTPDEEDCFELSLSKKLDGTTDVRLVLVRSLDRETRDLHHMKVLAYDGGLPPRSGSIEVEVVVTDANDNAPVFEYDSYEVGVVENIAQSTTVARVRASDRDIEKNGQVVHYFSSQTIESYGDVFAIDASTGEMQVVGVVDFESTPVYRLIVNAKDGGQDPLTSETMIVIRVKDANDNPPLIVINTLVAFNTNIAKVTEGIEPGSFVAHILVSDADSGLNGQFNCSLDVEDQFQLRSTSDGEYMILNKVSLDREQRELYRVQLTCMDGGQPPLASSSSLDIGVVDINDHDPRFEKTKYDEEVFENNYLGASLVQVTATDDDKGQNAQLLYKIPENVSQYFEIDSLDGTIRAKDSLDRERISFHHFYVYATDKGDPVRTGSALISLTVLDVNDEAPVFRSTSDSLSVPENRPAGTEVGVLSAQDADDYPLNAFSFSFLHGGSLSDAFAIDRLSGRITTTRILDREEREFYQLIAVVRDDNSLVLSSTATVSIFVYDENDNGPTWVEPSWLEPSPVERPSSLEPELNNITMIVIPSLAPAGIMLIRVRADDPDAGLNGQVVYSISGKDPCSELFDIDSSSGRVTLTMDMSDCADNVTLELNVTASDLGSPARQSSARLRFLIERSSPPPVPQDRHGSLAHLSFNLVVILALSVAAGSGAILSIIVIAFVMRNRTRRDLDSQKYNCRVEAIKAMNLNDATCDPTKSDLDRCFRSVQLTDSTGKGSEQSHCSWKGNRAASPGGDAVTRGMTGKEEVTSKAESVAVLMKPEGRREAIVTRTFEVTRENCLQYVH